MFKPPVRSRDRSLPCAALLLGSALTIAGCAAFPKPVRQAALRTPQSFATAESFTAPQADWPADRWWRRYGDPQLDALIEEALRDAPDMAAAAARLRAAEASAQVARAPLLPKLDGSGRATVDKQSYNDLMPAFATPRGWQDSGRLALDFGWELDFWGRNRAALAAAISEREASRADLAAARLTLAAAIGSAYAELARLHAAHDAAEKSVAVRTQTAALFVDRFTHGLETRGGVREADARRAASEANLLALEEQMGLTRQSLAALLGAGPDRALTIARPGVALDHGFGLPAALAADLIGRRPDVVAARLQAEAAAGRVAERRAAFYPNVNLSALIGVQSLGLDVLADSGSVFGSVGPAVSLPIFTGGRLRGELKGAEARYAEAVARYDGALTQALKDVADAVLSQRALAGQLQKAAEAVDAAAEAHRVASDRYRGGLASYLEVLSAEDALLENVRALTDLRSRAFALDVALMRALGGGYETPKA